VVVKGADTTERDGGEDVLVDIKGLFHRLKKIWADGGYTGEGFARIAGVWDARLRSSNAAMIAKDSWSFPNAGSWNVLSVGWGDTGG